MRILIGLLSAFLIAAVGLVIAGGGKGDKKVKLVVGEMAPGFSLPGSDGKIHSLSDHLGKQVVVIAWFPKAFTSG